MEEPSTTPQIFISYSRKDIVFAQKLVEELKGREISVWIDWVGIPPSVEWWKEIEDGIEKSDVFIFLISPDSIISEPCRKEIAHCVKNGKRIIPIVVRDPAVEIPDNLAKLNWIFMRESDDFDIAFEKLIDAIFTDFAWVKAHSRLQTKALDWNRHKGERSYLLRGKDLKEAESLLTKNVDKDPKPTELQHQLIQQSQQALRQQQWLLPKFVFVLMLIFFLRGKYYFLFLPHSRACPAITRIEFAKDFSALPVETQSILQDAIARGKGNTPVKGCSAGATGRINVSARPATNTEEISLEIRLPNTPAYELDFLPEIRNFGPEIISIKEASLLLQAASSYSLGEYGQVKSLAKGETNIIALSLLAQSYLFLDKLEKSQSAYDAAIQISDRNAPNTQKLRMGAALAWWRPLLFCLESYTPEGKTYCEKASNYYRDAQPWSNDKNLVHDIKIVFELYCDRDEWVSKNQVTVLSAYQSTEIGNFILATWCSPNNDGFENCDYETLLIRSSNIRRAHALLTRDYLFRKDDCTKAAASINSYRSEIINPTDIHELRILLQNQAIYCP